MPQYSDDEKSCSYQARLKRQRKNSGFDRVVKGRGFSRAVRAAKSAAALAAGEIAGLEKTFFRNLASRAINGLKERRL